MYEVTLKLSDIHLLTLTNVGVYKQQTADEDMTTLSTADKTVFDKWVAELHAAGRPVATSKG